MNHQKIKLYIFLENNYPSQNFNECKIKIDIFFNNIDKFKILDHSSFTQPKTTEIKIQNFSNYNKILEISKLSKKKIFFNVYFMMLYLYSNSYLSTYYINNWTIFSLSEVINHFNFLLSKDSTIEWLCLGIYKFGIGHYYSLRMNINNGNLFIQRDGGNNYNEIEENWQQYKNQDLLSIDYIDFPFLIYLLSSKIYDSN
jgi:hypothetical protein